MTYHQFLVSCELGGAGLTALHLARCFQDGGCQSRVWIPGEGPAQDEAQNLGLEVGRYRAAWALSSWKWKAACENLRIARLLRRSPGIVHVHGPAYYGGLSWGLRRAGLPSIVHVQIEEAAGLLRWALRRPPRLIVTCARYLVDYVRRSLPEEHRQRQAIVAVPNAVDTDRYHPGERGAAKQQVGAPADVPLLLMLANLAPHKGQETAIRAVAILKQRGVPVACWLAGAERGGEGTYTAQLHNLIQETGVGDRVRLLGFRKDTAELLRAADCFLLPSTQEGLPLAVLEAQATKVPVVAAPTAGIPEAIVDGQQGFLVAAKDAAGYAGRVEVLLTCPELRHQVAEQAFAKIQREYTWSTFCDRVRGLYQDLVRHEGAREVQSPYLRTSV